MRVDVNELMKCENETVQDYVGNRASRYLDSVMNGECYEGTNYCLTELISASELEVLKNHIYELIQPTIDKAISHMVKSRNVSDMEDDYASECKMLIWKNLFRYNNPKYKESEENYSLGTFIKPYLLEPIRKTFCQYKEMSGHQSRKTQAVLKAQNYFLSHDNKYEKGVPCEDIAKYMKENLNLDMSVKDVKNTLLTMQGHDYYDAYKEYAKAHHEDEIFIKESYITRDFKAFLSEMRPMQQFIFLQYFGYTSQRFENVSITQLIADPYFVRIVKADEVGRNHIKQKDSYTVKRAKKNLEKAGSWQLENVECVDVRFVSNERYRAKEHLLKLVQEREYSEEEVKANLFGLLEVLEEQIDEMFGL